MKVQQTIALVAREQFGSKFIPCQILKLENNYYIIPEPI